MVILQDAWYRLRWGLAASVEKRGLAAGVAAYGVRQLIRVFLMPKAAYFRWKYRENEWERRDIIIQDQVGGLQEWDEVATAGFSFLKNAGLQPHHRLLDAGCGCFRIGRLLIGYLDPGGYSAFDGSEYLLTEGRRQILDRECDLERKQPDIKHLFITDRVVRLFDEFSRQYDVILLHGVFEVVSPARINVFLQSIASVMHPHTKVYATFFLNPFGEEYEAPIRRLRYGKEHRSVLTSPHGEYWHHTPELFQRLCAEIGTIRFVRYHDYQNPLEGMKMAEFGPADRS